MRSIFIDWLEGWVGRGVWRVIDLEEELVIFEINRYCKTNYTKEFEASNCIQDKIDTAGFVD